MDASAHERRDRCIDQTMTFKLRTSLERVRNEGDAKVAAFTRTGMPGVPRAVVEDIERERRELAFDGGADLGDEGIRAHAAGAASERRVSHITCDPMKTNVRIVRPNTLKL